MPGPGTPSRRATAAVVAVALALLGLLVAVVGGAGPSDPADRSVRGAPPAGGVPAAAAADRGLGLSFLQQRFDEGTRRAFVRVDNQRSRPLRVRQVGLDWPGFPGGLQEVRYVVPGGLTVDLRYLLPRADCSRAAGEATAYAVVATRDRRIRRAVPEDGQRFLDRLWQAACAERRIRRAVDVDFGERWTARGSGPSSVLRGHLVLERGRGSGPVAVDQVQGSVLFDVALPAATALEPGEQRARLPLEVDPGRCDEHGRSQSTASFLWRVWVELGDGEPLARVAVPPRPLQRRLLAFLDDACG